MKQLRVFSRSLLLLVNFFKGWTTHSIQVVHCPHYKIMGIKKEHYQQALYLLNSLNTGQTPPRFKRIILRTLGDRFIFGCYNLETNQLVGVGLYYLNFRDWREHTIHEGFTGLIESERGKGLGSAMRATALEHFRKNGFKGVSSRVSDKNYASKESNLRLGFRIKETYFENQSSEWRHYMVCDLNHQI